MDAEPSKSHLIILNLHVLLPSLHVLEKKRYLKENLSIIIIY